MKKRLLCSLLCILFFTLPKVIQAQIFSGNDNYLAAQKIHHKYTAWNVVKDHAISGGGRVGQDYGYYGQSPCDNVITCFHHCKPKNHGAWGNYIGRDSHYRSSFNNNDWHFSTNGVQVGTDLFRKHRSQMGMFFGYENSQGSNIGDRINANDYYFGLYGIHILKDDADIRTIINFGWQNYHSLRNDDRDVQASFNGNTVEMNIELGKRHYFNERCGVWSARPVVAIDWYFNRLGSGQESPAGGDSARYHGTDFSQLFFRFGTDLRYERGRWAVDSGMYYSYDLRGAELEARVSDENNDQSMLIGSRQGRSVLSFNIGGSYLVGRNFTLFGGYQGEVTPEQAGNNYVSVGHIGGAWRW